MLPSLDLIINMLTSEQVKNLLTEEQVIALCTYLQGDDTVLYDAQSHPIFCTCLDHKSGDSWKLYYYQETHKFHCYTSGESYDIFELVRRTLEYDEFYEAFKYVVNFFKLQDEGNNDESSMTSEWDLFQRLDDLNQEKDPLPERIINENILEFYPLAFPYEWLKENITEEALQDFGIRIDPALSKVIIPHRNVEGQLIGIRGRAYNPIEAEKMKYAPVYIEKTLYNFPIGKHLFGLYRHKEAIQKLKRVIIFEGEKSVMQCASYYPKDSCIAVATCGSNITQDQIDLLLNLGVEEVILAYDRDFHGRRGEPDTMEYERKLLKIVNPLLIYFKVYIIMDYDHLLPEYKMSPSDAGKEILEKLISKKKRVTYK